ncbi:hypothetical protein IWX49DRAFT_622026 [Phyllosticta citricarpa]
MATSRPFPAAETLSTDSSAMLPYLANPDINSFLHELLARDRDARLFHAIRDAGLEGKLPQLLQKLLSKMNGRGYLDVTDPNPRLFCKGFQETYSVFATDEGRKTFFGQDPPPDGMNTKPTYATPFVTSVKLMQSIDALSLEGFPSLFSLTGAFPLEWSSIGLLHTLYCLYYIFELNTGTSIEHHPALTLWLKSILKLEMLQDARISAHDHDPVTTGVRLRLRKIIAYLIPRYAALNLGLCSPREDTPNGSNRPFWSPDEFLRDAEGLVYPKDTKSATSQAAYFLDVLDSQGKLSRGSMDNEPVQHMIARIRGASIKSNGSKSENGHIITMSSTAESNTTSLQSPAQPQKDTTKPTPHLQITPTNFEDILPRMDRADAHQLLVNLPLDIASMETLNAVFARLLQQTSPKQLDDAPLAPLNLDPTIIACGYIQHGLRQLERQRPATAASSRAASATAPGLHDSFVVVPSGGAAAEYAGTTTTTTTSSSSTTTTTTENTTTHTDAAAAATITTEDEQEEEYAPADDAADTKRKITLLLLFMRNLIKKNIVGWPALQYDIQEICTRYSPFREVRAFRRWIETGEEG